MDAAVGTCRLGYEHVLAACPNAIFASSANTDVGCYEIRVPMDNCKPPCMLGEDMAEGDWQAIQDLGLSALGNYTYDKTVPAISSDGFDPGYMFSPTSRSCRSISDMLTDEKALRSKFSVDTISLSVVNNACMPSIAILRCDVISFSVCRDQAKYQTYEWVPNKCDFRPWSAIHFAESVRNKHVVFAGDSILKNLFQSLVCQLESAGLLTLGSAEFGLSEPSNKNIERLREVRKVLAQEGAWRLVHLVDYNATLRFLRSEWLVEVTKDDASNLFIPSFELSDAIKAALPEADLLILETGAWWNNGKTMLKNSRFFGYSDENFPYGQGYSHFVQAMWDVCDDVTSKYPELPIIWATSPMYHNNCHLYSGPGRDLDDVLAKGVGTVGFDYGRINAINRAVRALVWNHKNSRKLHLLPLMERGDSHPGTGAPTDFEQAHVSSTREFLYLHNDRCYQTHVTFMYF